MNEENKKLFDVKEKYLPFSYRRWEIKIAEINIRNKRFNTDFNINTNQIFKFYKRII